MKLLRSLFLLATLVVALYASSASAAVLPWSVDAPTPGEVITQSPFVASASPYSPGGPAGGNTYEFWVDGAFGSSWAPGDCGRGAGYSCATDVPLHLANGAHQLLVKALDSDGNSETQIVNVTVDDHTAPVLEYRDQQFAKYSDTNPSPDGKQLFIDGEVAGLYYSEAGYKVLAGYTTECQIDIYSWRNYWNGCESGLNLTNGVHTLRVRSTDAAGNQSAVLTSTFVVSDASGSGPTSPSGPTVPTGSRGGIGTPISDDGVTVESSSNSSSTPTTKIGKPRVVAEAAGKWFKVAVNAAVTSTDSISSATCRGSFAARLGSGHKRITAKLGQLAFVGGKCLARTTLRAHLRRLSHTPLSLQVEYFGRGAMPAASGYGVVWLPAVKR